MAIAPEHRADIPFQQRLIDTLRQTLSLVRLASQLDILECPT
jgi:hypothetical protein